METRALTPPKSAPQPKAQNVAPNPPEAKKQRPTPQPATGTKPYKVYGKKAGRPAHTRFKGHAYGAGSNTKFKSGDTVNVGLGSDGRLSVNDPASGHTQAWDSIDED